MIKTSSELFAYNLKNLKESCKMRGNNRKQFLENLEFMRTHEFKKIPKKDNPHFGMWVKRKHPLKKINNFKCPKSK